MAVEVTVTARAFDGLVNPYTGVPMNVSMVVTGRGEPMFHSRGSEYSTWDAFPTAEGAIREWSRENGVYGLRRPPFRCAYTGEPLTLEKCDGGYRFTGGFNPKVFRSREAYLYYASMRDGVSEWEKPSTEFPDRVDEVVRVDVPAKRRESKAPDLTQDGIDAVKGIAESVGLERSPTVSMSVPRKGKK